MNELQPYKQQWTVKPVTQIAAQLRASFASRCAGRWYDSHSQVKRTDPCLTF